VRRLCAGVGDAERGRASLGWSADVVKEYGRLDRGVVWSGVCVRNSASVAAASCFRGMAETVVHASGGGGALAATAAARRVITSRWVVGSGRSSAVGRAAATGKERERRARTVSSYVWRGQARMLVGVRHCTVGGGVAGEVVCPRGEWAHGCWTVVCGQASLRYVVVDGLRAVRGSRQASSSVGTVAGRGRGWRHDWTGQETGGPHAQEKGHPRCLVYHHRPWLRRHQRV